MLCWLASSMASVDRWAPVVIRMLCTLWADTAKLFSPALTRNRSPCLRRLAPKVLMTSCTGPHSVRTRVAGENERPPAPGERRPKHPVHPLGATGLNHSRKYG